MIYTLLSIVTILELLMAYGWLVLVGNSLYDPTKSDEARFWKYHFIVEHPVPIEKYCLIYIWYRPKNSKFGA